MNFDHSSIPVCNTCNKEAKCVQYGRRMFLNVHTGHHTNLRTPKLIMLVSLTFRCGVGSADVRLQCSEINGFLLHRLCQVLCNVTADSIHLG